MPRTTGPLLTLPDKSGVLYVRLYQRMRALILDGSWPAGMRLPSSRTLASDLGISRNTVALALDQLLADGWIETRSRSGTFVSRDVRVRGGDQSDAQPAPSSAAKAPVPFELSPGAMDAFPFQRWAKLQSQVWARSVPHLLYEHDRAGDLGLRKAIAAIVGPARGMHVDPEQVIMVTGTQGSLDLVAWTLGPGTAIVEDPGYLAGQAVLAARGMTVVPVRVDEHGLDVAAARAKVPAPSLIVTTPALQFPTGATMSRDRRVELLQWADDSCAWIVEDDYDAGARFDGSPTPDPLREERDSRVITSMTLNRLLFRSLRLGFMIVPDALRERLLAARSAVDEFVNLPNQLVLRRFIEDGGFTAHVRRCRELHAERREALLQLVEPYMGSLFEPELNSAGLHLVLRPVKVDASAIADALRNARIACTTLAEQSRLPDPPQGLLLGFAAFSPDVIGAMRPAFQRALDGLR